MLTEMELDSLYIFIEDKAADMHCQRTWKNLPNTS